MLLMPDFKAQNLIPHDDLHILQQQSLWMPAVAVQLMPNRNTSPATEKLFLAIKLHHLHLHDCNFLKLHDVLLLWLLLFIWLKW